MGPDGPLTPLPSLPGYDWSRAYDVNVRGEVVGIGTRVGWWPGAVVWDGDGHASPLPPLEGDIGSEALAVNVWGEVVGNSIFFDLTRGRIRTAVRWDRSGRPVALPPLPLDREREAIDVNGRGEVAGNSGFLPDRFPMPTAVVWDRRGRARALLPLPGDTFCAARPSALSERWRAGAASRGGSWSRSTPWSGTATAGRERCPRCRATRTAKPTGSTRWVAPWGAVRPVIWDPQGRPTALPLLPGDDLGVAYDLDLRGNVVGYSRGSDGRRSHSTAVRWVPTRDYR